MESDDVFSRGFPPTPKDRCVAAMFVALFLGIGFGVVISGFALAVWM